jgi:hypothetical protein
MANRVVGIEDEDEDEDEDGNDAGLGGWKWEYWEYAVGEAGLCGWRFRRQPRIAGYCRVFPRNRVFRFSGGENHHEIHETRETGII